MHPADHPVFWNQLKAMEEANPALLENLLAKEELEQHLTSLVDRYLEARWKMLEEAPQASEEEIDLMLASELVNVPASKGAPQKELTARGRELLAEFKSRMHNAPA